MVRYVLTDLKQSRGDVEDDDGGSYTNSSRNKGTCFSSSEMCLLAYLTLPFCLKNFPHTSNCFLKPLFANSEDWYGGRGVRVRLRAANSDILWWNVKPQLILQSTGLTTEQSGNILQRTEILKRDCQNFKSVYFNVWFFISDPFTIRFLKSWDHFVCHKRENFNLTLWTLWTYAAV